MPLVNVAFSRPAFEREQRHVRLSLGRVRLKLGIKAKENNSEPFCVAATSPYEHVMMYGETPYRWDRVMATITAPKKDARIDLRMTSEQKEEVELAASLSGISLSQWSLENLLASARDVIARSGHTVMSPEDFDAFSAALDRPMNSKLKNFVSQKSVWEE